MDLLTSSSDKGINTAQRSTLKYTLVSPKHEGVTPFVDNDLHTLSFHLLSLIPFYSHTVSKCRR